MNSKCQFESDRKFHFKVYSIKLYILGLFSLKDGVGEGLGFNSSRPETTCKLEDKKLQRDCEGAVPRVYLVLPKAKVSGPF